MDKDEIVKAFKRFLKESGAYKEFFKEYKRGEQDRWRKQHNSIAFPNAEQLFKDENKEIFEKLWISRGCELFINYGFYWDETKAGRPFWDKCNLLWRMFYKNMKKPKSVRESIDDILNTKVKRYYNHDPYAPYWIMG